MCFCLVFQQSGGLGLLCRSLGKEEQFLQGQRVGYVRGRWAGAGDILPSGSEHPGLKQTLCTGGCSWCEVF